MKYSHIYRGKLNDIHYDVESKIASYFRKNKDLKDVEWDIKGYPKFKIEYKIGVIEVYYPQFKESEPIKDCFKNLDDMIDFLEEVENHLNIE